MASTIQRSWRSGILVAAMMVAVTAARAEPKVGDTMKSFAGHSLTGGLATYTALLKGEGREGKRVLVVSTYGTWCVPCQDGLPKVDRAVRRAPDLNVAVVVIGVGDSAEALEKAMDKLGVKNPAFTIVPDPFRKIAARNGLDQYLPRTLVVDATGTVRRVFTDEGGATFEEDLLAALRTTGK